MSCGNGDVNDKDLHFNKTSKDTIKEKTNKSNDTNQQKPVKWNLYQYFDKKDTLNNNLKYLYKVNDDRKTECINHIAASIVDIEDENKHLANIKYKGNALPDLGNKIVNDSKICNRRKEIDQCKQVTQQADTTSVATSSQENAVFKVCEIGLTSDIKETQNHHIPVENVGTNTYQSVESEGKTKQTCFFQLKRDLYSVKDNIQSVYPNDKVQTGLDFSKKDNGYEKNAVFQYNTLNNLDPHDPEFINYCLHKYYRLNTKKWKYSSHRILKSLKKKYKSIRLLFSKDVEIMLKRVPENNCCTFLGQDTSEQNELEEKCYEVEKDSLVDPRVKSLSKALESGRNGKTGIEKTFKSNSVHSSKPKLKRCSGHNSRSTKWALDPDWQVKKTYINKFHQKSKTNTQTATSSWKISKTSELSSQLKLTKSKDCSLSGSCDNNNTSPYSVLSEKAALNIAVEHQRQQSKYRKTVNNTSKTKLQDNKSYLPLPLSMSNSSSEFAKSDSAIDEIDSENACLCSNKKDETDDAYKGQFCIEICRDSPVERIQLKESSIENGASSLKEDIDVNTIDLKDKCCALYKHKDINKYSEIYVKGPSEGQSITSEGKKRLSHLADASLTVTSDIIPNLFNIEDDCFPEIDQTELSPPVLMKEFDETSSDNGNTTIFEGDEGMGKNEVKRNKKEADRDSKTKETESDKDKHIIVSEIDDYVIYEVVRADDIKQNKGDIICNNNNVSDINNQQSEKDASLDATISNDNCNLSEIEIIDVQGNAHYMMSNLENKYIHDVYTAESFDTVVPESTETPENFESDPMQDRGEGNKIIFKHSPNTVDNTDQENEDANLDSECFDQIDSDATDVYQDADGMLSDCDESNTFPTMPMELKTVKTNIEFSNHKQTDKAKYSHRNIMQFVFKKRNKACKGFYIPSSVRRKNEKKKYNLKSQTSVLRRSVKSIRKGTIGRKNRTEMAMNEHKGFRSIVDQSWAKMQNHEIKQGQRISQTQEIMENKEMTETQKMLNQEMEHYKDVVQSQEMTQIQSIQNQEIEQNQNMVKHEEMTQIQHPQNLVIVQDQNQIQSHELKDNQNTQILEMVKKQDMAKNKELTNYQKTQHQEVANDRSVVQTLAETQNQEIATNQKVIQCQEMPIQDGIYIDESQIPRPECPQAIKPFKRKEKGGQRSGRRSKSATNTNKDPEKTHITQHAKKQKRGRFYSEQEAMLEDTSEERLMRDFPKHNWLFNKYSNSNSVDNIFKRKEKGKIDTIKGREDKTRSVGSTKTTKIESNTLKSDSTKPSEKEESLLPTDLRDSVLEDQVVKKSSVQTATGTTSPSYCKTDCSEKSIKLSGVSICGNDQIYKHRCVIGQNVESNEEVSTCRGLYSLSKPIFLHSSYSYGFYPKVTKQNIHNDELKRVCEKMETDSELSHCHGNRVNNESESSSTNMTEHEKNDTREPVSHERKEANRDDSCGKSDETRNEEGESTKVKDTLEVASRDRLETDYMPKSPIEAGCQRDLIEEMDGHFNEKPVCNTVKCLKDSVPSAVISGKTSPVDLCINKPELSNMKFRQRGNLPVQRVQPHVHIPPSSLHGSSIITTFTDTSSSVYTSSTGGVTLVSTNSSLPLSANLGGLSRTHTQDSTMAGFEARDMLQASETSETSTELSITTVESHEKVRQSQQSIVAPKLLSLDDKNDDQQEDSACINDMKIDSYDTAYSNSTISLEVIQTYGSELTQEQEKVKVVPSKGLVTTTSQGITVAGNCSMVIPVQPMVQSQSGLAAKSAINEEHTANRSQSHPAHQGDEQQTVTTSQRSAVMISNQASRCKQHLPPPPLLIHSPSSNAIHKTAQDLSMSRNDIVEHYKPLSSNRLQQIFPLPQLHTNPLNLSSNIPRKDSLHDSQSCIVNSKSTGHTSHLVSENLNLCTQDKKLTDDSNNNANILSESSFGCVTQANAISKIGTNLSTSESDRDVSHSMADTQADARELDNLDYVNEEIKKEMEALDAEIKRKEIEQEEMRRKKLELLQKVKHSQSIKPLQFSYADKNESLEKIKLKDGKIENKDPALDIGASTETNSETFENEIENGKMYEKELGFAQKSDTHANMLNVDDEIVIESDCSDSDSPKLVVDEDKPRFGCNTILSTYEFNSQIGPYCPQTSKCESNDEITRDYQDIDRLNSGVTKLDQNVNSFDLDQVLDYSLKCKKDIPSIELDLSVTVKDKLENLQYKAKNTTNKNTHTVTDDDIYLADNSILKNKNEKHLSEKQNQDNEFLDLSTKGSKPVNYSIQEVKYQDKLIDNDNDTRVKTETEYEYAFAGDIAKEIKDNIDEETFVNSLDLSKKKVNNDTRSEKNLALSCVHIKSEADVTIASFTGKVKTRSSISSPGYSNISVRDITSPIITTDLANDALSALTKSSFNLSNNEKQKEITIETNDDSNKVPEDPTEKLTKDKDIAVAEVKPEISPNSDTKSQYNEKALSKSDISMYVKSDTDNITDLETSENLNENDATIDIDESLESGKKIERDSYKQNSRQGLESKPIHLKKSVRYIELLPAHFKPCTKIQKTDKPIPAHQKKISTREILKKLDKIQMKNKYNHNGISCPYACRIEPYCSSPNDWKEQKTDSGDKAMPLSAHSQEPFRIPGYLIVQSRKGGRKRKHLDDVNESSTEPKEKSESINSQMKHAVNFSNKTQQIDLTDALGHGKTIVSANENHWHLQSFCIDPSKTSQIRNIGVSQNSPLKAHIDPNLMAENGDVLITKVSRPPIASDRMPLENKNQRYDADTVIDLTSISLDAHLRKRHRHEAVTDTEITIQQELTAALAKRQKIDGEKEEDVLWVHDSNKSMISGRIVRSNSTPDTHCIQDRNSGVQLEQIAGKQQIRFTHHDELGLPHQQVPRAQVRLYADRQNMAKNEPYTYQRHANFMPSRPEDRLPNYSKQSRHEAENIEYGASRSQYRRLLSNDMQGRQQLSQEDHNDVTKTSARQVLPLPIRQEEHYSNQSVDTRRRPSPSSYIYDMSRSTHSPGPVYFKDKRRVQPQIVANNQVIFGLDTRYTPDGRGGQPTVSYQRLGNTVVREDVHNIPISSNQSLVGDQSLRRLQSPEAGYHQGHVILESGSTHSTALLQKALGHVPPPGYQPESLSPGSKYTGAQLNRQIGQPLVQSGSPRYVDQTHQSMGQLSRAGQQQTPLSLSPVLQPNPRQLVQLLQQKHHHLHSPGLGSLTTEEKMRQVRAQHIRSQMHRKQLEKQHHHHHHHQLQQHNLDSLLVDLTTGQLATSSSARSLATQPQQRLATQQQMAAPLKQMAAPLKQMASPQQRMAASHQEMITSRQQMTAPLKLITSSPQLMTASHQQMVSPQQLLTAPKTQMTSNLQTAGRPRLPLPRQYQDYQGQPFPASQQQDSMRYSQNIPSSLLVAHGQSALVTNQSDCQVSPTHKQTPTHVYYPLETDKQTLKMINSPLNMTSSNTVPQNHLHYKQQRQVKQKHQQPQRLDNSQSYQDVAIKRPIEGKPKHFVENEDDVQCRKTRQHYDYQQQLLHQKEQLQYQNQQIPNKPHYEQRPQAHLINQQQLESSDLDQQRYKRHKTLQHFQPHHQSQSQQQQMHEQTQQQRHHQEVSLLQSTLATVEPQNRGQIFQAQCLQQIKGACVMCGKSSMFLCSKCKQFWYCSPECQLKHWRTRHAAECRG